MQGMIPLKRFWIVLCGVLVVLLLFVLFVLFTQTPEPDRTARNVEEIQDELVRVEHPTPDQVVTSPLRVEGKARGTWYFEASFPVKLLSEDGRVIAEHYAQAEGEWMTEDFVPFTAKIPFSVPEAPRGWLVLERANPSGRAEWAEDVRVPVRFPDRESDQVSLYFNRQGVAECEETVAVSRRIARTPARARVALENLFAGPTRSEAEQGYLTSIPEGVVIERLVIEKGTAQVGLNEKLDEGVAGSCRVRAIRSQIENTLRQFSTVDDVVISIDGRTDEILQP